MHISALVTAREAANMHISAVIGDDEEPVAQCSRSIEEPEIFRPRGSRRPSSAAADPSIGLYQASERQADAGDRKIGGGSRAEPDSATGSPGPFRAQICR